MRWILLRRSATMTLAAPMTVAHAVSPVNVVFGNTWDPPSTRLQNIVDSYIGVPGAITVTTDYVGAHAGDLDLVVLGRQQGLRAARLRGRRRREQPARLVHRGRGRILTVIDVDDGLIFDGPNGPGSSVVVVFPNGAKKFGFWLNPNGPYSSLNAPEPEKFFTNRTYNDLGASGVGALHAPFDGDVQALVFDVSQWKGLRTRGSSASRTSTAARR